MSKCDHICALDVCMYSVTAGVRMPACMVRRSPPPPPSRPPHDPWSRMTPHPPGVGVSGTASHVGWLWGFRVLLKLLSWGFKVKS